LPTEPTEVEVVLKGTALGRCRYNPRLGPDRKRSGVISIGSVLGTLVHEGERLPIVRNLGGAVYIGDWEAS